MRWFLTVLGVLFGIAVFLFLDYALPSRQTVRITNTYNRLTDIGANRIFSAVTFPLFTNGLDLYQKSYDEGLIDGVISTNLTYRTPELQAAPWFIEADMSKYISYIIATLNHDRSLSKLLSPYDRVHNLMNRYKQEQEQG